MDKQEILKRLGFPNDAALSAYLKKLYNFYQTLSPDEQRIFLASMAQPEDALDLFDDDLEAEDLEKFIRAHEPPGATVVFTVVC